MVRGRGFQPQFTSKDASGFRNGSRRVTMRIGQHILQSRITDQAAAND
jgi:hypothetical protein